MPRTLRSLSTRATAAVALSIALAVLRAGPVGAAADQVIDWSHQPPTQGRVVADEVELTGPGTFELFTMSGVAVTGHSYAISGQVRYEGVVAPGYLEMWSEFSDGARYFSRTLAAQGPLAALSGESSGRPFLLPFELGDIAAPDRVTVNVVLPGAGTVWVAPVHLQGFGPDGGSTKVWWGPRAGSLLGAALGVGAGVLGAIIGVAGGRARNRRLVFGAMYAGLAVSAAIIAATLVALVSSQPRQVWLPLLIAGIVLSTMLVSLRPALRRAYQEAELRRIHALDRV
jgi:hypothetical protein